MYFSFRNIFFFRCFNGILEIAVSGIKRDSPIYLYEDVNKNPLQMDPFDKYHVFIKNSR